MGVNFLEAIMGTHVDVSGMETGLQKAEQLAESATKKIAGSFNLMAVGITAAIAGAVVLALQKAISTTAEFGLELEHLSNRMGMSARDTNIMVDTMERFGVNAGTATRALQIMAMQSKATTDSLDPFQTKMGRLLGTLRDTNGQVLNMQQVFDLARQKVSGASSEMERLQIAQALFGSRMAGQVLPLLKLSNEEWAKMRDSIAASQPPVEKAVEAAMAYKKATAELEDSFRDLQVTVGVALLPVITKLVEKVSEGVHWFQDLFQTVGEGSTHIQAFWLSLLEKTGAVAEGTAEAYINMEKYIEASKKAAAAQRGLGEDVEETAKREAQLVKLAEERVRLAERARSLGMGTGKDLQAAVDVELARLASQRKLLESQLEQTGVTPDIRMKLETDLQKNRIEAAQVVAKLAESQFREEELHMRAMGALNQSTEIDLLQRKLGDERIVGDERLKIEADVFEKRKAFTEEAVKLARQLGALSADDEIAYRKQKAAEALGKGDVLGAGQEIIKARDLAIQQAEQVMEFTKKIRVVSLQDEIEFQKQKLDLVRGNAEEEMKVISKIADLDKQLYDKRLEFNLNYTQSIVGQYNKIMDAARKTGEVETFERARVESERKLVESTREARQVLAGGGTAEQRQTSVEWSQFVYKQVEQMQQMGKEVSGIWKEAADTAKDILKAATGGEEVRAPGGPSPTVGSIMSPVEGLATSGLARGSDIPRLDTSFTDLATRVRDVLLGTIPNVQNLSNAFADAAKKIAQVTGFQLNPGIVGPGGAVTTTGIQGPGFLPTGGGTPAPPTVGPGGVPIQPSTEIGVGGFNQSTLASKMDDVIAALNNLPDKVQESLQTQASSNAQSLQDALTQAFAAREAAGVNVSVGVDPNTGDMIVTRIEKELSP